MRIARNVMIHSVFWFASGRSAAHNIRCSQGGVLEGRGRRKKCRAAGGIACSSAGCGVYLLSANLAFAGFAGTPQNVCHAFGINSQRRTYANCVYVLRRSSRASETMSSVTGQASLSGAWASLMMYRKFWTASHPLCAASSKTVERASTFNTSRH